MNTTTDFKKDFDALTSSFRNSIKTWDYFVNWQKVFANKSALEITLNKLNYLLGKDDLKGEFARLYQSNLDIVKALPVLLAVREQRIEVFDRQSKNTAIFDFDTKAIDGMDAGLAVERYFDFLQQSGLTRLFQKDGVKNLVDYVMGVEVGLDSNARKNRVGFLMEAIVEAFIADFCKARGFAYLAQATPSVIKSQWQVDVAVNKSARSFDFAVYNPHNGKIKLFETNFYNGKGSKLKAVCGEFKSLYDELKKQGIDFVWITDGLGWHKVHKPLAETYQHNDYVFNLSMVEAGVLDRLVW